MPKKKKRKSDHSDAAPTKSLGRELTVLRRNMNRTARAYERKLKVDMALVASWNATMARIENPTREQLRNLGDMLGLLRKLKVKPEKGRRRDLRKIEAVVEDLIALSGQKAVELDAGGG